MYRGLACKGDCSQRNIKTVLSNPHHEDEGLNLLSCAAQAERCGL